MTRKASEVIIELESKINKLLEIIKSQEFTLQLISNKLNKVIKDNEAVSKTTPKGAIFAEAVDVKSNANFNKTITKPETIPIGVDDNVDIDTHPHGHRRVNRHEGYTGKNSFNNEDGFNTPVQVPQGKGSRVISKDEFPEPDYGEIQIPKNNEQFIDPNASVPVAQKVINSNGKAIFMAEVNVLSMPNLESITKSRTGGTGKWSASLKPGSYRVLIKSRNRITKDVSEKSADIVIDGSINPMELDPIIF